jgi:hypothetical protein
MTTNYRIGQIESQHQKKIAAGKKTTTWEYNFLLPSEFKIFEKTKGTGVFHLQLLHFGDACYINFDII